MRIGYLVPEFPGQTHAMFRREIRQLALLGVETVLMSTRRPGGVESSDPWADGLREQTTYLYPPDVALLGRGFRFLLAAGPAAWFCLARAIARSERPLKSRFRLGLLVMFAAELAAVLQDRGATHLHVHSCADAADVARFARMLGGPPYSLTLHGPLEDYGLDQHGKWGAAEFGIVITPRLREDLCAELGGDAPAVLEIAGMGVDSRRFSREDVYKPWSGEGPARLFSCGRLNPAKGHLDLLEAVRLLVAQGLPVELRVAGEDEAGGHGYRQVLEKAILDKGLSGSVELLGACPEDVVAAALHRSHVFVLASLSEPLGVAIMEAMTASTPVVTTDAGGVRELVNAEEDGVLVPPGDAVALARAIGRVLRDQSLARRLSVGGRVSIGRRNAGPTSADVLATLLGAGAPRIAHAVDAKEP